MDMTYGYKDFDGTGLSDEILASSHYEMISITIAGATRDSGNTPTTDLRRGLLLAYDSGSGKYIELTTGATESPTAVVLAENVPGMDATDVVSKAFYRAIFKSGKLFDDSASFDPTLCPRISIRDNA